MSAFPQVNPLIPTMTLPLIPAKGGTGYKNINGGYINFGASQISINTSTWSIVYGDTSAIINWPASDPYTQIDFPATGTEYTVVATESSGTAGQILQSNGEGNLPTWVSGSGPGSVTSVSFTGDGTVLSSTPSTPVTTSGTVTASLNTQSANKILAGPTSGSAANPTFRSLVATDLPAGTGSVTSVSFTGDGTILSSTPSSPVTTSGTVPATLKTQSANKILAGPTSGSPTDPTFRSLIAADLPSGTGTVTSVSFTGDGTILSSTPSSAVTTSGTVPATLKTQSANKILAGPTSGSAANPIFRSLVIADMPQPPSASAYESTGTTLAVSAYTKILYNTKRWDNGTYFDTTNHRYLPLIAGIYLVNAYTNINTIANTDYQLSLFKNGNSYKTGQSVDIVSSTAAAFGLYVSCLVQCNGSSDYLEIWAYNSNASTTVTTSGGIANSYFDVVWVSP